MKRSIVSALDIWKRLHSKTPLMLIGARQTGKTYVLREFCKNNFRETVYINFEERKEFAAFFEQSLRPEEIVARIEVFFNRRIDVAQTVFFLMRSSCAKKRSLH